MPSVVLRTPPAVPTPFMTSPVPMPRCRFPCVPDPVHGRFKGLLLAFAGFTPFSCVSEVTNGCVVPVLRTTVNSVVVYVPESGSRSQGKIAALNWLDRTLPLQFLPSKTDRARLSVMLVTAKVDPKGLPNPVVVFLRLTRKTIG